MTWNLVGHHWAADLLAEHIAQGRIRHAYLITGPEGVGRRTLAIRFAQALNCEQPLRPGVPCGECRACRLIERQQHPDLTVMQSERRGATLKVDAVREIQHTLSLAPYEAAYRVAVLLRFEEATDSAQNALLKTLEEPPARVVLILTAESAERLLPTIVSRCEVLRLRPLPFEEAQRGLEGRGLEPERARWLVHVAGGRPGYALRLDADQDRLQQRQTWLEEMLQLLQENRASRFAYADRMTREKGKEKELHKERQREALLTWLSLWRDVMLRAAASTAPISNLDQAEPIEQLANRYGVERARAAIAVLNRSLERLEHNASPRLVWEVLMLDLPR